MSKSPSFAIAVGVSKKDLAYVLAPLETVFMKQSVSVHFPSEMTIILFSLKKRIVFRTSHK